MHFPDPNDSFPALELLCLLFLGFLLWGSAGSYLSWSNFWSIDFPFLLPKLVIFTSESLFFGDGSVTFF